MEQESRMKAGSAAKPAAWLILLVLASAQFTNIVDFMVIMPLGPQLTRVFQMSAGQFGLIVSVYTIAAGLAGFLGSSFLDRFSRKGVFLTLYGGFLLGTLFCGLSKSYGQLLAARMATGAFGGILGGLSLAIVGDVFPEERRGRAAGILMSAFAVASVVGVPTGLSLGTRFGWNLPFLLLAGLCTPILALACWTLPPLREHLRTTPTLNPWKRIAHTFSQPDHLRAFALTASMMLGGFSVIPYISLTLVANVGVTEGQLPLVFVSGGLLTLIGSPMIGRLADRYGKASVYRVVASISIVLMLALTNLPAVPLALAVALPAFFMVSNAGRMVAALALVTSSVPPARRGGFMSANSAVQHLSSGLGAYLGGQILSQPVAGGPVHHYGLVGLLSLVATAASLYLVGRVRPVPTTLEALAGDESPEPGPAGIAFSPASE